MEALQPTSGTIVRHHNARVGLFTQVRLLSTTEVAYSAALWVSSYVSTPTFRFHRRQRRGDFVFKLLQIICPPHTVACLSVCLFDYCLLFIWTTLVLFSDFVGTQHHAERLRMSESPLQHMKRLFEGVEGVDELELRRQLGEENGYNNLEPHKNFLVQLPFYS